MDGCETKMRATDILALPPDVLLTPVEMLEREIRERLNYSPGDYVISRPRLRSRSLVVESAAANFLERFRSPKNVVEAVIAYSLEKKIAPEKALDEVLPLVTRMRQLRLLVLANSDEEEEIRPTLFVGEYIADFRVTSCIHIFDDVEVYKVADRDGHEFALKMLRPRAPDRSRKMLEREAAILRLLNGRYSPSLITKGSFRERAYLVMTWCAGKDISSAARELRSPWGPRQSPELIELCIRILRIYSWLHKNGIVHGDVHPNNVLVGDDGSITLIDFGLSCCIDDRYDLPSFGRAGVAEYIEPEYCHALELHHPPPPATTVSEQYALAALCYFLITSAHYLDFSLERKKWRLQILHEHPRAFSSIGLPAWPEVELTLAKALAKNPSQRFNSVSQFSDDLLHAIECAPPHRTARLSASHNLLEGVLQRFGRSDSSIRIGLTEDPKCSVNYGASGIAYFFYRIACLRDDADLLATADIWSSWSRENAAGRDAFHSSELGITSEIVGPSSFYHGETGVQCIQALISHAMGDFDSADKAVLAFLGASSKSSDNIDLTLGISGLLIGCATMLDAFTDRMSKSRSDVKQLGHATLAKVWKRLEGEKIQSSDAVSFLGVAHGWAGILYAILRWSQATAITILGLEDKLHELGDLGTWKGSTAAWPLRPGPSANDRSPRTGWCHGSAGYVHLWTLAYRTLGDPRFLRLAEAAAKHIWESLDIIKITNGSSCCGYAGQGYALLSLYRLTADTIWLRRAQTLCERAVVYAHRTERRSSLYKGDIGIALLAEELSHPELSCTPLFEPEGWKPIRV